jgi:hypothetical protein
VPYDGFSGEIAKLTIALDWVEVPALETCRQLMARTANRMFVGPELCKNKEWTKINLGFVVDLMANATLINFFPDSLRWSVGILRGL